MPNFDVEFVFSSGEVTVTVDADDREEAISEAKQMLLDEINGISPSNITVYDEDGEEVN